MITKLQDTSIEKVSGGAVAIEYPDIPPMAVLAITEHVLDGPAGERSPIFRA